MIRYWKNQKGSAFPVALFIIIGITIMFGILLTSLQNEVRARVVVEERTKARYLAEAGAEHLMFLIREREMPTTINQNDIVVPSITITNIGNYTVLYTPGITKQYSHSDTEVFQAVGTNENGRSMTIEVTVRENSVIDWKEIYE